MNGPEIIAEFRSQLARRMADREQIPSFDPLPADPWLAMAALQKSIRRGRRDIALRAAARLLIDAPDRLWRRLGGIAFEDVGLADIDTVGMVVAALGGKRVRAAMNGEWATASFLVEALARAPKCRAADDLLMAAERHPAYAEARQEFSTRSTRDLLAICTSDEELPTRALASWYSVGVFRPSKWMRERRGEPQAAFDHLFEVGLPPTLVAIARDGFRRTGEPLAALLPLLWPARHAEIATIADDETPSEGVLKGGLPGWFLDRYSRAGRQCLQAFLHCDTDTVKWITANVPTARRLDFLGDVLFRVEGQICKRRIVWPTATELRRRVDLQCHPGCSDATDILDLMRADIEILNGVRAELNGGFNHV